MSTSEPFVGLWRAQYLLPYPESSLAKQDRRHVGMFVHVSLVSADDAKSVVRQLKLKGAESISVTKAPLPHPLFRRVSSRYKGAFIQALLFAVEGGISPGRALESMILSESGAMRTRFNVGLDLLQGGRPFIEVMRSLDIFDSPTLAIIEAGDEAGKLKSALSSARAHLAKSDSTMKIMFGAISMTALDIVFAASSIVGIRFGLLPKVQADGPGGRATAEQTVAFNNMVDLAMIGNNILLAITVFLVVAILWGLFSYFGRDERRRDRIDAVLIRLPFINKLYLHSAISSTSAIMANLLRVG